MPGIRFKFEVSRQASSPSLCASVRAVPWADDAEQQLSRLTPSGCVLSADARIFRARLRKEPGMDPPIPRLRLKFELARQASSPSLCASVRAVPWADDAEQQLSRTDPSVCVLSADVRIFGAGLRKEPGWDTTILRLRLKFEVARQASSPSLCASVRPVPWADEAEQQLSRLTPSGCQLIADVHIVGAGLRKEPGRDPPPNS